VPPGAPGPIPEWWERLVARLIDGVLYGVAYFIVSSLLGLLFLATLGYGSFSLILTLPTVIAGLLYAGYDFYMHSNRNGQTLGKLLMKTRLVAADGSKPDQAALLKRAAIYPGIFAVIGLLGFTGLFGTGLGLLIVVASLVDAIPVFTDLPLRRAMHDKWTDTIVIKVQ